MLSCDSTDYFAPLYRFLVGSLCLAGLFLLQSLASAAPPFAAVPPLVDVQFSVGSSAPGMGLPGTAVAAETAGEAGLPAPFPSEDDIFVQPFPGPPPWPPNGKVFDDGGAGFSLFPPGPPVDLTIRSTGDGSDVDAYAHASAAGIMLPAPAAVLGLFVQFSVDVIAPQGAPGPFPPDVFAESTIFEAGGDVFEGVGPGGPGTPPPYLLGPGPGTNTLIADEGALGLFVGEDLDGLIINELGAHPLTIDTDGAGGPIPDVPLVYFSVTAAAVPASGTGSGVDIFIPGASPLGGVPAPDPLLAFAPPALGLAPADEIDALFVDASGPPNLLFSLAPGSPSLATLPMLPAAYGSRPPDPNDIFWVSTAAPVPVVAIAAEDLGLVPGVGNLNALWLTPVSMTGALLPVTVSGYEID